MIKPYLSAGAQISGRFPVGYVFTFVELDLLVVAVTLEVDFCAESDASRVRVDWLGWLGRSGGDRAQCTKKEEGLDLHGCTLEGLLSRYW